MDPRRHDIRFVEDNWEHPMLGAAGLGWEVWIDGMEITQFTYFQQVGGLRPIRLLELTYGLERLALYLQDKESVYDLEWVEGVTYGDVFRQAEYEHSKSPLRWPTRTSCSASLTTASGSPPRPGGQTGSTRLRLGAEVLPYLQPAGSPGAISVTADRLHRPGARSGEKMRQAYVEELGTAGIPLLKGEKSVAEGNCCWRSAVRRYRPGLWAKRPSS